MVEDKEDSSVKEKLGERRGGSRAAIAPKQPRSGGR